MKRIITIIFLLTIPSAHGRCTTQQRSSSNVDDTIAQAKLYYSNNLYGRVVHCVAEGMLQETTTTNKVVLILLGVAATKELLNGALEEKNAHLVQQYLWQIIDARDALSRILNQNPNTLSTEVKEGAEAVVDTWKDYVNITLITQEIPIAGIRINKRGRILNRLKKAALQTAQTKALTPSGQATRLTLPSVSHEYTFQITGSTQSTTQRLSSCTKPCRLFLSSTPTSLFTEPQKNTVEDSTHSTPWGVILGSSAGALVLGGLVMWFAQPEAVLQTPQPRNNRSVH